MEIYKQKKILRKEILNIRKNINIIEKENMDRRISDKFYESKYYKQAKKIFIYISYDSEINTKCIINQALKDGKKIYVPRTEFNNRIMDAVEITSLDNLVKSEYGILEPSIEKEYIDPSELDLIVVPGVAFDISGGRLGYGAGFYDRYFKKIKNDEIKKIIKLVLAYEFQIIKKIPMDERDIPVNHIITENNTYDI